MKFISLFLLCFLSAMINACSHSTGESVSELAPKKNCPAALVVLPDNYIIELAAGSIVELNPAIQQFALFCTVEEAKEALNADLAAGRIQGEGRWRIYSLNGDYEQLAVPCGEGQVCLGVPATVLEWVD